MREDAKNKKHLEKNIKYNILIDVKCRIFVGDFIMRTGCLEEKIQNFIDRKRRLVFLRVDFEEICPDYDQVGRALKKLVKKGKLLKVGYGLYTKAKISSVSGRVIPRATLPTIGKECLKRLKVQTAPSRSERDYNQGISTQVPTGRVIAVKGRITRKIGYSGVILSFEKNRSRAAYR